MSEASSRAWDGRSRGGGLGHRIFVWVVRHLGIRAAYVLLVPVTLYFLPFAPRSTRALWLYYRRRWVWGRSRSLVALWRHYYRFGQTLVDKVAVREGMDSHFHFSFDGLPRMLELLDQDTGAIVLSAHVGCWEMGTGFFGEYGRRMHVVMLDAEYQRVKEALRVDPCADYQILPIGGDNLETVIRIRQALQAGEYVCFQGDRYLREEDTLRVELLGRTAHLPLGPFLISARMRVPVVLYLAVRRSGRRYRFIFRELPPSDSPQLLAEAYAHHLEGILHQHPEQWFNLYNYWHD